MKKIFLLLTAVAGMALTQSCEGDAGPQGPQGEPGISDGNTIADVYETQPLNFAAPSYGVFFTFPVKMYTSDHLLVYRFGGVDSVTGDDIWQPLPKTYYFDDGTRDFTYSFDFTISDVNIYLEGNDLATLSSQYRNGQIFRIVTVPGAFVKTLNAKTTYKDVTTALHLQETDLKKVSAIISK